MKVRRLSGRQMLLFVGCMAIVALVAQQVLSAWGSTRKVPYFGYYFIEDGEYAGTGFNYVNEVNGYANLAQIQPDRTVFTTSHGAQFDNAGISVFVQLGISPERLFNPSGQDMTEYLDNVYTELSNANLWDNVIAIAPGEEWHLRLMNENDVGGWSEFAEITPATHGDCTGPNVEPCYLKARKDHLASKLNDVIAVIEARYGKPSLLVDSLWNDTYNLNGTGGYNSYRPAPSNVDILGIDAYMGYQYQGYSSDCGPGMQQKFIDDVRWVYDHALANYSQPILVVGQAFTSTDWPMPSTCQLDWWYELAQSNSRFFGLAWFAYGLSGQSPDKAVGVRSYSEQLNWLRDMYLHNESIRSISFRAENDQWMVAEDDGGGAVNANRDVAGPWETFALEDLNGGDLNNGDLVAFRTGGGSYLQAEDGGGGAFLATGAAVGPWETFTIVLLSGGDNRVDDGESVALRSVNDYYVVAEGGGGDVVNADRTAVGPWETWRVWIR